MLCTAVTIVSVPLSSLFKWKVVNRMYLVWRPAVMRCVRNHNDALVRFGTWE